MSSTIPERREFAWPESAVFALDRWLRKSQHVYEYTTHPQCLFRIQCVRADCAFEFADGTRVHPESRILRLHFWNEQVPVMGRRGPTLAWARRLNRAIYTSLLELARYLGQQPDLGDIAAVCVDARVSGTEHAERLRKILVRYGFETVTSKFDPRGVLHRFGDALFIMMLLAVTNPLGLQGAPFRYSNTRIFLSRAVLEKRYTTTRTAGRVEPARLNPPLSLPLSDEVAQ